MLASIASKKLASFCALCCLTLLGLILALLPGEATSGNIGDVGPELKVLSPPGEIPGAYWPLAWPLVQSPSTVKWDFLLTNAGQDDLPVQIDLLVLDQFGATVEKLTLYNGEFEASFYFDNHSRDHGWLIELDRFVGGIPTVYDGDKPIYWDWYDDGTYTVEITVTDFHDLTYDKRTKLTVRSE